MPDEPVPFDPGASMLTRMDEADLAAGGTSFWCDRVLHRPSLRPTNQWVHLAVTLAGNTGVVRRARLP
jgi:hypothetical protein